MNGKFLYVSFMIGLAGCATPSYNYTQQSYHSTSISFPEIDSIHRVHIGESMLEQGVMVEKEVLFVPQDIIISRYLQIKAGQYEKLGSNGTDQTFLGNNTFLKDGGAVIRRGNIDITYNIILKEQDNKVCVIPLMGAAHCNNNTDAKVRKIQTQSKDAFQQTLIYSGKVGNKINIDYREFSGNVARPAFSTRVEYDLNESKQIGYKGALIEIIEANNQSIAYKVVRNFSK